MTINQTSDGFCIEFEGHTLTATRFAVDVWLLEAPKAQTWTDAHRLVARAYTIAGGRFPSLDVLISSLFAAAKGK